MTNKILISLAILGVLLATEVSAQSSAQAVMQVSVTVVKANQVEVPSAIQFQLSDKNFDQDMDELGSFVITGMNESDGFITIPDDVELQNEKGEKVRLNINTGEKSLDKMTSYSISAPSDQELSMTGNYRGSYKASVVYQ